MTSREDAVAHARRLVRERFPEARAAWLGGSFARGEQTATSDLDITVLLAGSPAPFRESLTHEGSPVELFVHTLPSLDRYRAKDVARRQPTIMRLVGESVMLVDTTGRGLSLQGEYRAAVAAGPPALTPGELAAARYAVTDLLVDLEGAPSADESAVIALTLWRDTVDLLLTGSRRWTGTGKWLVRELRAYDSDRGVSHGVALLDGLYAAMTGDTVTLQTTCDTVLELFGGRLFAGHRVAGDLPH